MTESVAIREDLRRRAADVAAAHLAPRAAETDRSEAYPWYAVKALCDAGLFGLTIPAEYGGPGHSFGEAVVVIEEVAKVCGVSARIVVEANMGALSTILAYGDEAQKQAAAASVLGGDKPAICITEPGAGSAASRMTTRADRRGDHFVLNGAKHWITGGGVSKLHLIFARAFDEAGRELGIGGFIAWAGDEGLVIGAREPTMGLRGIPETEIRFENLVVPASRVLAAPGGFAHGFGDLMNAYNSQRVGAATVALGLAQGALDRAVAYANERHQFDRPIAEFQGLQWMLADVAIQTEAARALIHRAADSRGPKNSPFPDPVLAAKAKVFAAEMAIKATNDALQVFGAKGYSRNCDMERIARDARMFTIGGGTAQVLRTLVAGKLLGRRLPQTRDGYLPAERPRHAAE